MIMTTEAAAPGSTAAVIAYASTGLGEALLTSYQVIYSCCLVLFVVISYQHQCVYANMLLVQNQNAAGTLVQI